MPEIFQLAYFWSDLPLVPGYCRPLCATLYASGVAQPWMGMGPFATPYFCQKMILETLSKGEEIGYR